ncbi:hypothetical protein [Frigoribacterium sp. 9N]|uniref:hypothetical protein n=1 Tax=Frigoribacterium sp. 9N TaxID=2653144 RepID=UPI0012F10171|nr:hypothetical protein [Frigoribacterium sp. 9N]VXB73059.1 hypothetical protein FRIGORI9N_400133 [Frigoribacterium sp. 9N]
MSPTAQSVREKAIAQRHAIITTSAATIAAITGVIALVISFNVAGEPARAEQRLAGKRAEISAEYVTELVGSSPEAMDRASSLAAPNSDADNYAQFLWKVWRASEANAPDKEYKPGKATASSDDNEYKVCLPKTTVLKMDCMVFGNFVFDESQSYLQTFTIDNLPVRALLVPGSTSNGVLEDPNYPDPFVPIVSGSSGWITSPDNESLTLVMYISQTWAPERAGLDLRTLYLSSRPVLVRDQADRELTSEYLLPDSIGPYESKYIAFNVANPEVKYVRLCGYLDGEAERCWWIQALPPSTPS